MEHFIAGTTVERKSAITTQHNGEMYIQAEFEKKSILQYLKPFLCRNIYVDWLLQYIH